MKIIDLLKKEVVLLSMMCGVTLTGCSSLNRQNNNQPNSILCEVNYNDIHENYCSFLEGVMGIDNFKVGNKNKMNFTYLIDLSDLDNDSLSDLDDGSSYDPLSRATFAELIDSKTITSKMELGDGKSTLNTPAFYSDGSTFSWQPIIIPDSYKDNDLIELMNEGSCDVNCKKLLTMDGETLYYFTGSLTDKNGSVIIESSCLYQFTDDNNLVTLYRNQTGIGDQCENILKNNFNNNNEVVYKLKDTVFKGMSGEYKESYLREALDVYLGEDRFFSSDNEGKDFSSYKKILKED